MAAGIVIERTPSGKPGYARIDLRKYGEELRPFFKAKGVVLDEVEREIKFTPKLLKAMWEVDNKIGKIGDRNNFWDITKINKCEINTI